MSAWSQAETTGTSLEQSRDLQVGAENAAHLGNVVSFTVEVLIARFQAELSLAGADRWWASAVAAEGRGHREGLHPGFSPEGSFTYRERDEAAVSRQER